MTFQLEKPFALFENQLEELLEKPFQLFTNSQEEIKTNQFQKVPECLDRIQLLSRKGYYLVGFMSYEAMSDIYQDSAFEFPLIHFHAFKERSELSLEELKQIFPPFVDPLVVYDFKVNETFESYRGKLIKIKNYLLQGDTYQVNFTMKNHFKWQGNPLQFFFELRKYQKVAQASYFHFDQDFCSFSPELFINKTGRKITSKPMKGTAPRGANEKEDELIKEKMLQDQKTLSENLMIVDLIRNDLGRIALPGSVAVPEIFKIETYATLHQMISTVEALIPESISLKEIMQALFPCGSITGAPKVSTMKIIRELEAETRGIYTGAMGYILPIGDFNFNVVIRTLELLKNELSENAGEIGIGSGIVFESEIKNEWDECLLKSKFVKLINSHFQLIESFLYQSLSHQFLRLDLHLNRLSNSAQVLGFNCNIVAIKDQLEDLLIKIQNDDNIKSDCKVRILLNQNSEIQISYSKIEKTKDIYKVVYCKTPIQKKSILQKHKTTLRSLYDNVYQKAFELGYDEVLFFNEDGKCVEASRHNIIIHSNGKYLTPSISDGALPGVYRSTLILDRKYDLKESSLSVEDIEKATDVYLCNSVRGLVKAIVLPVWLEAEV